MISDGLNDLTAPTEKPRVNVGEDGGDIQTGPLNEPITNWDFILKGFGLVQKVRKRTKRPCLAVCLQGSNQETARNTPKRHGD